MLSLLYARGCETWSASRRVQEKQARRTATAPCRREAMVYMKTRLIFRDYLTKKGLHWLRFRNHLTRKGHCDNDIRREYSHCGNRQSLFCRNEPRRSPTATWLQRTTRPAHELCIALFSPYSSPFARNHGSRANRTAFTGYDKRWVVAYGCSLSETLVPYYCVNVRSRARAVNPKPADDDSTTRPISGRQEPTRLSTRIQGACGPIGCMCSVCQRALNLPYSLR